MLYTIFTAFKEKIDIEKGITNEQAIKMAKDLRFEGKNVAIVSFLSFFVKHFFIYHD